MCSLIPVPITYINPVGCLPTSVTASRLLSMELDNKQPVWCALACKNLRIGSYEMKPRYKVVFTKSHIKMKVQDVKREIFVDLKIPLTDIMHVVACLTGYMPALYIYLGLDACKEVRRKK